MDTSAAADELYGLVPEQFTERRAELAAEAKAAGAAELRSEIMALRKPTVAAWTVNLVVREHPDDVQTLLGIAAELRAAQRGLAADRMRELSEQRRAVITGLLDKARAVARAAGKSISETVLREVQASFEAAVADENAERALRTGRLTTSMSYSGFGEVDISEAVAALDARPRLAVVAADPEPQRAGRATASPAAEPQPRSDVAERARQRREQAVAKARAQLAEATQRRDELVAEAEQLRRRLADIERELKPAQAAVRSAQRKVDAAER